MLRDNKLPLPSESRLNELLKKLRPAYGFSDNIMHAMKEKAEGLPSDREKHGQ